MRNAQVVVSCSLFLILVAGCGPSVRVKNAGVPTSQSVAPTGIWKAQGVAYASPATESQEQQPGEVFEFPPNALEAIHPLMPEYPQESQKRGVEGPAVVELWIGTEGLVLNKPQIVVAPDQAIGESVVKAVSQWAFKKWRPEFPSKADKGREDLVFYFVLKNNKPMVVRYEGELPAGKTFPPFPRSLRERQTFNPENMLSWCRTDPANEIIGGQQPGAIPRVVCYYSGTGDWRRIQYEETLPDVCSCGTGEMDEVLHCQRFEPTQGPVLSGGACDAKSLKSQFTEHVIGLSPEGLTLSAQNIVMPRYPEQSQVKGATGPVVVEVMIGPAGNRQGRPEIVVAPDQATGYAVVEAVRQWTFPSFVGGDPPQPEQARGDLTFYFVLDKGKALVARSAAELPPGTKFPPFPHSLAQQKVFEDLEQIRMLQPSAFPALPAAFRADLEKRGCLIPQQAFRPESSRAIPNNVIKGQFAAKGQTDWAVLCSKDWQSRIIVFWQKPSSCPSEFGLAEDGDFLQDDGHGHMVYSRGINTFGKAGLRENADLEYRPLIKHDGLEDGFIGRGSGYSYCHKGKWIVVGNYSESLE